MLLEHGAIPVAFPLIEISGPESSEAVVKQLIALDNADIVVFVSPNAVTFAAKTLPFPWAGVTAKFAAIGDATARSLLDSEGHVDIYPAEKFTTEELLSLPEFSSVRNKSIAIICGDVSRDFLQDELVERGAKVEKVVVYRNRMPEYSSEQQSGILKRSRPQVICITSNQGILNLNKIADDRFRKGLLKTPLIVNSERCSKLARSLGFKSAILVARNPGDQGQLEALQELTSSQLINYPE